MRESDLIIRIESIQEKTVKNDGIIYIPWNIIQSIVKIVKPTPDMSIIEPSYSHGVFLIGLLCYINEKHGFIGKKPYDKEI